MEFLDVNAKEVIQLTAKLERLNKSAFPSAVRNTLNQAAFKTRNVLPTVGAKQFEYQRNKAFLKYYSVVNKADGWNVNKMASTVGIDANKDRVLAENLESQEFGGMVRGKKIVPHDKSRVSGSRGKRVSRVNSKNKINAHNANRAYRSSKGTRKSKFVAAVLSTAERGKKHMLLNYGNRGMIYEVKNVRSNRKTKKLNFKVKKLYNVRKKDSHVVKPVHFMQASAFFVAKDLDKIYKKSAEYQFNKVLR